MTPEAKARQNIDALLTAAGWHVCSMANADIHAGDGPVKGVAIREFPLNTGYGFADYLLYINGKAAGVIEAKKEGATLSGVEVQSARYAQGLPASLPAWRRPLPFLFESTGVETHFTNGLDPQPRARGVFAFFRPELLAQWLAYLPAPGASNTAQEEPGTFLARMQRMPELVTQWGTGGASYQLWPAQIKAVTNLEKSLAANKPKALIQMATGSGKTFTSISFIYRLIKFADARRVLFLVDRGNLARQTKKEFDAYASPYNNFKFGEEYIVQHLQNNQLDTSARVVICTIQRMFSMLKGRALPEDADEESTAGLEGLFKEAEPIGYNPAIPIESFDIVVTDEAHRSIYNLWRQVLEYFDAYLIGLTATPNKQTFGFFNQNLVMEYNHAQAVADGVNVNYDVYRIKTEVTEAGAKVDKGYWLETMDRATRRRAAWQLDEDFAYDPAELDRAVQTPDQIRTVVRTLRDRWQTDLFPQREELPKTLVFAKDDNHAEAIVQILREEFGRGNEFAQKITYRTTGTVTQDSLIAAGFAEGSDRAKDLVQSFEDFIKQHKDEITALQILYSRPTRAPLKFEDIKALADALHAPPHLLDETALWQAYAALQKGRVKGASQRRLMTDLVSLVRFAMQQDNELVPYPERVQANFKAWLAQHGKPFTQEQQHWLEMIRDHIAANLGIEIDDFEYAPFSQEGGLGRVHQLFGAELPKVIEELTRELAA